MLYSWFLIKFICFQADVDVWNPTHEPKIILYLKPQANRTASPIYPVVFFFLITDYLTIDIYLLKYRCTSFKKPSWFSPISLKNNQQIFPNNTNLPCDDALRFDFITFKSRNPLPISHCPCNGKRNLLHVSSPFFLLQKHRFFKGFLCDFELLCVFPDFVCFLVPFMEFFFSIIWGYLSFYKSLHNRRRQCSRISLEKGWKKGRENAVNFQTNCT